MEGSEFLDLQWTGVESWGYNGEEGVQLQADHRAEVGEALEEDGSYKVASGQWYVQGGGWLVAERRSLVEVELGYRPSEECLRPGEDVAVDGLLVVEEVGVVRNVAVEA